MSSLNTAVEMDVDGPVNGSGTTLKRCSSAPMINESNTIMTTTANVNNGSRDQQGFNLFGASQPRTRRFSASFSPVPGSPVAGHRLGRVSQLRQEEHADISNQRELAHEREIHSAMQISQSWEDLSLMEDSHDSIKPPLINKMGPLHVNLPPYSGPHCNSPSPTRLSSPGFQSPTRASRTFIRRSASPVLRPSPLGVKRKLDDEKSDFYMSPRAKRFHSYSSVDRGGLLTTTNTNTNSTSLPGSLSSVGTPESLSSADSPGFNFRNVESPQSPPNRSGNGGSGGGNGGSGGGGGGQGSGALPPEPMCVVSNKIDHEMNDESPS